MENHPLPRRSASHGTLRGSYANHGRPLHKPLRSVNENSALLPSPGALESMLKTTTETGDIGIFSIKPVSSSANLGVSSGKPGSLAGKRRCPLPRPLVDHRNKFHPPYRDTTSEILSMYGSTSQSSFTSTVSPSTDDLGQRSYSMTTCGSRHLSHHKSSTTMSQASGGNTQRPRSPYPYPTRLKRPGARPSSPAVTENGIVDYSRMVEIDRVSLRTCHGPLKPSQVPSSRRPPPLGLRADANQSAPSLHGHRPMPMRHPPRVPSSMRTASAASMASLNVPFRERFDSTSSRTSSLTSVINMYHRMPPAIKATHLSPAALPPPPRYYDYTEDFESKQTRSTTPVQPIAPVPTRAPSVQRPLVLREGTEEQLAAALGVEADSAFFDEESHCSDSPGEQEQNFVEQNNNAGDVLIQGVDGKNTIQLQKNATESHEILMVLDGAEKGRKQTRGSDIDLLPSQLGRESVDTFNPNLDIESRDVAAYSYPDYRVTASSKTNTATPERQVQLQNFRTPSIRSERGVILRDDAEEEETERGTDHGNLGYGASTFPVHVRKSPNKWRSRSGPAQGLLNMSSNTEKNLTSPIRRHCSTDQLSSRCTKSDVDMHLTEMKNQLDENDCSRLGAIVEKPESRTMSSSSRRELDDTLGKENEAPLREADEQDLFRRHKRKPAALNIVSKKLPSEDDDGFPQLTPSCSQTPLISPKPISPARQLKVKNSIPQLMKALPPLPGEPGYVPSTTPTTTGEDDDFSEVLAPFRLFPPGAQKASRTSIHPKAPPKIVQDEGMRLPSLQRKLPKIRPKSKDSGNLMTNPRDSRPWNSDHNYPWNRENSEIQLKDIEDDEGSRVSIKRRLKLRGSRSVGATTPPFETVRRNPDARGSDIVANLANQQPKDLFSLANGLSSAFRQVSRKLSRPRDKTQVASENPDVLPEISDQQANTSGDSAKKKKPGKFSKERAERNNVLKLKPHKESEMRQRGLKKSLSNMGWLMERSTPDPSQNPVTERQLAHGKMAAGLDSIFGTDNIDFDSKNFTVSEGLSPKAPERSRFKRRVRDKVSKWVKHTRAAVKSLGRRSHAT